MLEIDNQRLYNEIDQLKQTYQHQESILPEKLIHPLPSSNVISHLFIHFLLSRNFFSSHNHYLIKQFSN